MQEENEPAEPTEGQIPPELAGLTNPDAAKVEKYNWEDDFQRTVVGLLLNDRWFLNQCRGLINPAYFVDERHAMICSVLFDHVDQYKTVPIKTLVIHELNTRLSSRDERVRAEYILECELIYKKFVPGIETREYLLKQIVNFAKLMSLKAAFDTCIFLVKKDRESEKTWATIREELQKALLVERNFEEGLDYFRTFEERYARMQQEEESREIFTSGFSAIDDALLGGGCHRGEIYSWIGLSGSGKSLALVGAALRNVTELNKRVLYVSLEMGEDAIAERFDAQIANVDINQLQEMKDKVRAALENNLRDQEDRRMLIIKQFPAGSMDVASLRAYMQQLQMVGFRPDLLVIDYIGEMRDYPGIPTYESRYRIVRDLRGLATEEDICIFTAMQPNKDAREAQKKDGIGDGVIDDTNLADSYGQIRPLDGCWSINQMQAEKEASIARIFVIKHRHGKSRFTVHAQYDMKTLQIRQISEGRYNEIWKDYSFKKTEKYSSVDAQVSSIVSKGKSKGFSDDAGYDDPDQPDIQPPLEETK